MNAPYILAAVSSSSNRIVHIPVPLVSLLFTKQEDIDKDKYVVTHIESTVAGERRPCECIVSSAGERIFVSKLKVESPEEFWIKASAAGLVYGETGDSKLFSEPEKECYRLKEKVKKLEEIIEKYKSMISNISNELFN